MASPIVENASAPQGRVRLGMWRWVLAIALAAVLLYKALHGVDWAQVWLTVISARWGLLAGTSLISVFSFILRALRWRVLLNAGTATPLPAGMVFRANMAGYLGNNILPARAGEVIRSLLVSSQSSLSRAYVLTTAVSERMVDAIVLVLCGSVVLSQVAKLAWMERVARTVTVAAAAGAVALMVLPHAEGLAQRAVRWLPFPPALKGRLEIMVGQILLAIRAFHNTGRFVKFALFTVGIWASDATGLILSAHALGLEVTIPAAVLLLTAMGLGSALPSTPGYVGIYQFAAVSVLGAFGIARDQALAYSLVTQALGYIVIGILGVPGFSGALTRAKAKSASR
jgi:glycosyltransferase 2 family protein